MSIKHVVFPWTGWRAAEAARAANRGRMERFPTHSRVVLPDGNIALVRVASLVAAKDLLAAQRAAERRARAPRPTGAAHATPGAPDAPHA